MNDTNEEINEIGQSVISVFQYIYFMSDIIMPVHTQVDTTSLWWAADFAWLKALYVQLCDYSYIIFDNICIPLAVTSTSCPEAQRVCKLQSFPASQPCQKLMV